MAIRRYDPWTLLNQVQEMSKLFEDRYATPGSEEGGHVVASDWVPAVDIKEEKNRYVILADLPGVDPKTIDITMENGVLALRGDRALPGNGDDAGFKRVERARGTFYRRFTLPDSADAERISARGENGVLEIVIPKHERMQPRRIQVGS